MSATPNSDHPSRKAFAVDLPSGRKVSFHLLDGQERRAVMNMVLNDMADTATSERIYTEHTLACMRFALETDNGKPVVPDYTQRYDEWEDQDQEFFMGLYREMTAMSDAQRKQVKTLAKSLLGK